MRCSNNYTRRGFLKAVGAGAAVVVSAGSLMGAEQRASGKPNILMILADDLGYGDLSSYGATDLNTPHIDKLVSAGMRFDNFYTNCPVCSPTRAALLSGRYPDLVGVPGVIRTHITNSWGYLVPHAVLLPKMLKTAGYQTAIVGKWHLGLDSPNTPIERGFDHFQGFLGDMMDDYYSHRRHGNNYMRLDGKEIDPEGHATDLFTRWAIDYVRQCAAKKQPHVDLDVHRELSNRGQDARETQGRDALATKPFFLYLAYNAPHTPIQPPDDWLDCVRRRQPGIDENRTRLIALIEHLDNGIGKVLDALKDTGVSDNTLVIFTSDNGGQLSVGASNGTLTGGKGQMYEGGIRVPMSAVWPGKIKPDTRSDRVVLTMDLYPTICEAAGAKITHQIDGQSILPTLLGESQPDEDRFLFWVRREGGDIGGRAYYAARYGHYKLLQNSPFEPMELYNLNDDPREQKPLGRKHKMYQRLFTALRNHIIEAGAVPWQKYPVEFDHS